MKFGLIKRLKIHSSSPFLCACCVDLLRVRELQASDVSIYITQIVQMYLYLTL